MTEPVNENFRRQSILNLSDFQLDVLSIWAKYSGETSFFWLRPVKFHKIIQSDLKKTNPRAAKSRYVLSCVTVSITMASLKFAG
jgi:hypothetical protein